MNSKYKLKITGKNLNYFLSLLMKKSIFLYSVDLQDEYLIVVVCDEDYEKVKKLKTSYKIQVINVYGKKKYFQVLNNYKVFLFGLGIAFLIITILSNVIFEVEVVHTKKEIQELIQEDLELYGIKKYNFKVSFEKKEQIIEKILKKEKDRIEWLEIESVGTKYIVKVEERKKNKENLEYKEQHIVAAKDAMILEINAEQGEVIHKKYDYVKKGDVLISGFIKNKEKIMKKTQALGSVFGEVWYEVTIELPKKYEEVTYLDEEKNILSFEFLNKTYSLFDFKPYETYHEKKTILTKSNILPISLYISKQKKTKVKEEVYTRENAGEKAIELAYEKLLKKIGPEDSIISKKTLKIIENDSKIIVTVFFKVKEDITDTVSIEEIDIENIEEES